MQGKYRLLAQRLDESSLRLWAAAEALGLGRGGVTRVARECGMSRTTIYAGMAQLTAAEKDVSLKKPCRRPGGGRKALQDRDFGLLPALRSILGEGSGQANGLPLRWTEMSTRELAIELSGLGHVVSQRTVCKLLDCLGYARHSTRRARRNIRHPDRDAQFAYVAQAATRYLRFDEPVVALDLMCERAAGVDVVPALASDRQEWSRVRHYEVGLEFDGEPLQSGGLRGAGRWAPEWLDLQSIDLGIKALRRWWLEDGRTLYPRADRMLVSLSHGGLSPEQLRYWQVELRRLVEEFRLQVQVCHLPPGTSKWTHVRQRVCCQVVNRSPGRPAILHQAVLDVVRGFVDPLVAGVDELGEEGLPQILLPEEMASLASARRDSFHGEWNYRLVPHEVFEASKKRTVYFY